MRLQHPLVDRKRVLELPVLSERIAEVESNVRIVRRLGGGGAQFFTAATNLPCAASASAEPHVECG